jgi:hypothetical protein
LRDEKKSPTFSLELGSEIGLESGKPSLCRDGSDRLYSKEIQTFVQLTRRNKKRPQRLLRAFQLFIRFGIKFY